MKNVILFLVLSLIFAILLIYLKSLKKIDAKKSKGDNIKLLKNNEANDIEFTKLDSENILDAKAGDILDGEDEFFIVLNVWKGFQNKQRIHGYREQNLDLDLNILVSFDIFSSSIVKYEDCHVKTVNHLYNKQAEIKNSILNALLEYYPFLKEVYREEIPTIISKYDFQDLISLNSIHIFNEEIDGYTYLGFSFDCSWDEEHGLGVKILKDKVIEVGHSDIAY